MPMEDLRSHMHWSMSMDSLQHNTKSRALLQGEWNVLRATLGRGYMIIVPAMLKRLGTLISNGPVTRTRAA